MLKKHLILGWMGQFGIWWSPNTIESCGVDWQSAPNQRSLISHRNVASGIVFNRKCPVLPLSTIKESPYGILHTQYVPGLRILIYFMLFMSVWIPGQGGYAHFSHGKLLLQGVMSPAQEGWVIELFCWLSLLVLGGSGLLWPSESLPHLSSATLSAGW